MIKDILFILLLGMLKIVSGIDFTGIAALYVLIISIKFSIPRFLIFIAGAELFNFGFPGAYILGLGVIYFLYISKCKIFHKFFPVEFLLFSLGYLILRFIYNLPILIYSEIDLPFFISRVISAVGIAVAVTVSFWGLNKCLTKFIKAV